MSKRGHLDSDVVAAVELRKELVDGALGLARTDNLHSAYFKAFESMRNNRIYVWEPPAMEAFWQFWSDSRNYRRFLDQFFTRDGLTYRPDLASREFHIFPAPGRLFGDELLPTEYRDNASSIIFPPTTHAIGISPCEILGQQRLSSVIQTIQADPKQIQPERGLLQLERISALPRRGTPDAGRLVVHLETRYPKIVDGVVTDRKPITWLICIYQLQIFLLQPFVGNQRKVSRSKPSAKGVPQPPQEIVQVLMREPLPVRIPRYIVAQVHPVTGRKLEFEVDVRTHERHCASGVVTQVRAHKRGPNGKTREKVIKVIR